MQTTGFAFLKRIFNKTLLEFSVKLSSVKHVCGTKTVVVLSTPIKADYGNI